MSGRSYSRVRTAWLPSAHSPRISHSGSKASSRRIRCRDSLSSSTINTLKRGIFPVLTDFHVPAERHGDPCFGSAGCHIAQNERLMLAIKRLEPASRDRQPHAGLNRMLCAIGAILQTDAAVGDPENQRLAVLLRRNGNPARRRSPSDAVANGILD